MNACKLQVTSELLFAHLGLERSDELKIYNATVDQFGIVTLYVTGSHPALPIVNEGEKIPFADVTAKRIESTINVRK